MKKQFILILALALSVCTFAQKKELKAAEKAIKSNNFSEAKSIINQVESMLSSMDDKTKAKFYFLKGEALYANGAGTNSDIEMAMESFDQSKSGYTAEIVEIKKAIESSFLTKANELYKSSNFVEASKGFNMLYKIVPTDTTYLYYAAASAVSGQDYESALVHYNKLKEIGYTGIQTQYLATNMDTGEEEVMDKKTRDLFVKSGSYSNPREQVSESKLGEITKNIALILSSQGKPEEALEAIKDARFANPENVDLIINEANMYLQLEDEDKFKALMEEAVQKQPNNASLHYNIGVMSMKNNDLEVARNSFSKVLALDPTYADAALNLSTSYIDEGNGLIEEMNSLGSSAADDKKYDELKAKKTSLFQKGADLLINFMNANPNAANLNILEQLRNIYNALGETAKAKEIEAQLDGGN
jgi:tetratricopeptide (TPR) repeat protein